MTCPVCGAGAAAPRYRFAAYVVHACPVCGSGFRVPLADPATEAARYDEGYFAAWGGPGAEPDETVRRMKRATFAALLQRLPAARPGDRLLDVGCATGFLLEEARDRGWQPSGIERSAWAAGIARRALGDAAVHVGDLADAPFPAGTFSVVTLVDVLEHLPDPAGALARVAALLRPGGAAVVVTPSLASWSRRILGRGWPHFKEEHLWYLTPRSLDALAERGGLVRTGGGVMVKRMTVAYVVRQLEAYPRRLVTPLARLVRAICPPRWRTRPWPAGLGEIRAVYRRG